MIKKLNKQKINLFILIAVLSIGIILRAMWIIYVPTVPISDFLLYHEGAKSIISGKGFQIYGHLSSYEPIGYPAFLALLYSIFGSKIIVGKIANLFLSIIGLIFFYLIIEKAFGNKKISYACLLIYVFLPLNIVYTSVLSTEITFTTLYLILIFLIFKKNREKHHNIIIGVLLGILSLIKPFMMIYGFVIFILDLFQQKKLMEPLKNLLIITIFMALTISPWTIRNYFLFNKLIPTSTNGGYNLYVNNNPYATGAWQDPFKIPNSGILKYKDKNDEFWDEVKVNEEGKKLAFNWIKNNPIDFYHVGLKKLKNVFLTADCGCWATDNLENNERFKHGKLLNSINTKIHFTMVRGMIAYFILILFQLCFKKVENLYIHLVIMLNILFQVSINFVFEGQPRYLFPLWPFLITGCVYFIAELVSGISRISTKHIT